jgi:ribosomal protein S18 acetylase RimI-like enzyme
MIKGLSIRPAKPQDASPAADLLYSTGPLAFNLAFGSEARARAIIRRLFAIPGNPMSFEYTQVAELAGLVAGILTLSDRAIEIKTQPQMGRQLLGICGPMFLLHRLPIHLRLQNLTRLTSDGELCIEDIAVLAQMRGKGIGKILMNEAEALARRQGYCAVSLYVLRDNFDAIGFYRRLGYIRGEEKVDTWLKNRYGFPGFLRMFKSVGRPADKLQYHRSKPG